MNFIKRLAANSMVIEWILIIFVTFTFDVVFMMKYGFDITFRHLIIALFNVLFVVSAIALIKNNKRRHIAYTIFILIMFTFFITDSTLYRFKEDVTSIAMLLESGKTTMRIGIKYNPLKAYSLWTWLAITVFVVVMTVILSKITKMQQHPTKNRLLTRLLFLGLSITSLLLAPNIVERTDQILFNTPSDKALFVQKFGSITYHAKDIFHYTTNAIRPILFKENYIIDINNQVTNELAPKTSLFASQRGKNVIMIMCETCEQYGFVEEYTPNYYRLKNMSLYYNEFFSAAKSNYTYDAEFKSLSSMMYYQADNYYYSYVQNAYPTAIPNMLKREGYTANSFHNYNKTFFNRDKIHLNFGFDSFSALEDLVSDPNYYYPLDRDMFEQFKDRIAPIQEQPFFSFVITVTPHGPHDFYRDELKPYYDILNQDPRFMNAPLELKTIISSHMNFDEGLGLLLDDLEAKNLMDDTIIVLFSDHKNYSSQHITLENTPNSNIPFEIEKVPFMIYAKGIGSGESNLITSHYDITPTLLDLLGISYFKDFYYGQSFFDENRLDKPIILSYSSWITLTHRVQFGQVVLGTLDEESYFSIKDDIFSTIQFYEKIFFSDYFRTENPFYLVDMLNIENGD